MKIAFNIIQIKLLFFCIVVATSPAVASGTVNYQSIYKKIGPFNSYMQTGKKVTLEKVKHILGISSPGLTKHSDGGISIFDPHIYIKFAGQNFANPTKDIKYLIVKLPSKKEDTLKKRVVSLTFHLSITNCVETRRIKSRYHLRQDFVPDGGGGKMSLFDNRLKYGKIYILSTNKKSKPAPPQCVSSLTLSFSETPLKQLIVPKQ